MRSPASLTSYQGRGAIRGFVPPPKTTITSALGSSPVGKYWDSSDRSSQFEQMELLLNHKIAIARLSKTIGNRLLLSLFVLETLRDRLDVHSKLNKAIIINRLDSPRG